MCRRALIAGVFAWSILPAAVCGAADQWVEVKSAHFTVVSSAGQSPARDLAWQLEQIRSAIATIWPWARLDLSRPFLVFADRDEQSMRALVPRYWEVKGSVHPARILARERKFDDAQKEIQAATELARSDEEQQRIHEFAQWLNTARKSGGA